MRDFLFYSCVSMRCQKSNIPQWQWIRHIRLCLVIEQQDRNRSTRPRRYLTRSIDFQSTSSLTG